MDSSSIFLGIKVKPGPIERFTLENYSLDNTVDHLKNEAGKKVNISSSSLVLIYHGKILKADTTLQDSGVKHGEMVHVVKRKIEDQPPPRTTYHDAELQSLNVALRSLGCTPNALGWTRAMQLLNEESVMNEILSVAPSVGTESVTSSILHEVELLAALGANLGSMRRGAEALPELPAALLRLLRIHRDRAHAAPLQDNGPAVSGFAYSLEALSEEEDAEDEEAEEPERSPITQEQLAAALMAASEAVSSTSRAPGGAAAAGGAVSRQTFLQLLRGAAGETSRLPIRTVRPEHAVRTGAAYNRTLLEIMNSPGPGQGATDQNTGASSGRAMVTPEAFNEAISEAITRAAPASVAMDQSAGAGSGRAVITPEAFNEAISEAITRAAPAGVAMDQSAGASSGRAVITPEAFNEAISEAITRAAPASAMDQSAGASSSQSPARVVRDNYSTQLNHMHEMGLLDDAVNIRALHICAGDVNAAINLVFSGAIGDD